MNDASETYARQVEAARAAIGRGDRPAAVEALSAVVETTRGNPALQRDHVAALVRLGILEQELGRPAEGERLLTEAVTVGERQLGADHPSLGAALNELSRLHIRQSNYSRAEPVLKRLLHIACAKGDRHPDVATALAGLAVAKRGLGEHAAAEVLYRHALRIREEVLAPDHMAIVITLEQLSETCATRGNLAEALTLLQRALPTREGALGVDHATVRGMRARIADLERRIATSGASASDRPTPPTGVAAAPPAPPTLRETTAPSAPPSVRPAPERRATPARPRSPVSVAVQPKGPKELVFLYQPDSPASRPAPPTRERAPMPARSVAAAASMRETAEPSPRTQSVALAPMAPLAPSAVLSKMPATAVSLAPANAVGVPSRARSGLWPSIKRATLYASSGAAVAALAIAGSNFTTSAPTEAEQAPSPSSAESQAAAVAPAPTVTLQGAIGATAREATPSASEVVPTPTAAAPTPAPASETPAAVASAPLAEPSAPVAAPRFRRLVVPKVAMPSVDSMIGTAAKLAPDAGTEPITAGGGFLTSTPNVEASVTPPRLVFAPALRFPDELRAHRVGGEVVVQFRVNEKGRVDASTMHVLQSEHELLTAAVRNVLPRFRFEPARLATPGSAPQSAWVQFRAQFNARN